LGNPVPGPKQDQEFNQLRYNLLGVWSKIHKKARRADNAHPMGRPLAGIRLTRRLNLGYSKIEQATDQALRIPAKR